MNEANFVLCAIIALLLLAGGISLMTKHIDAHNKRLLQDGKKRYHKPNKSREKQPGKDTGC